MFYLKCTKSVRDFAGLETEYINGPVRDPSDLGSWYVNMFTVDRRKTLIFMNERTLVSFIAYGVKKSNCSDLRSLFLRGFEQLLRMEQVPDNRIEQIIQRYVDTRYAKTDSRSTLGNLNDLVATYKHAILCDGGFSYCNLGNVIHNVNRTPQRNLGWQTSIEAMLERVDTSATPASNRAPR